MAAPYRGIRCETHLPDRLALRMLVQAFRPELMDRLVDEAERKERRSRLLPARVMMYFTLAMWLFETSSYEEVLAKLTGGLPEFFEEAGDLASAAAITRARRRLGVEPLKALCAHLAASAEPEASPADGGTARAAGRVLAFESVALEAPDTPANRVAFGAPDGDCRHLNVWLTSLTDCRTRVVVASAIASGADHGAESLLVRCPPGLIGAGTLVVGDEETIPSNLWHALAEAGADQVWQLGEHAQLPAARGLPDGSYLSAPVGGHRGTGPRRETVVRVVPWNGTGRPGARRAEEGGRRDRLVTSILDDDAVPADVIAARYARAGAGRAGVRQFTGQLDGQRVFLRSKSPELVQQEIYALLCTYHAVRNLVSPNYADVRLYE
jgi:hypothetical protein